MPKRFPKDKDEFLNSYAYCYCCGRDDLIKNMVIVELPDDGTGNETEDWCKQCYHLYYKNIG